MIGVVGVDHSVPVVIREKFSVSKKKTRRKLNELKEIFEEAVILSTCNRTEVYFKPKIQKKSVTEELFRVMGWDERLSKYVYSLEGREAVEHLMHLSSGFLSVVLGEEQILSQIKSAYGDALEEKSVGKEFSSLFRKSIRCGKTFRAESKLHEIPVSSSSIAVSESRRRYASHYMIIGYGDVGKLTLKYLLSSQAEKVYLVVRDSNGVQVMDSRVEVIEYSERSRYYGEVDCIISSTSAPHVVVEHEDALKGKLIFDLAVPRDVSESVYSDPEIEVYNIDMLRRIDDENQKKRAALMESKRGIIESYIEEFYHWKATSELAETIAEMQRKSSEIVESRHRTFRNKRESRDVDELARQMIESASSAYLNRAIEVMKSETLKGRGEECLKIIEKIFC
ncbi:glutamyl-tRNA reductase [Andreesenia angusta]|uniref:Glutamyl-tRNA reductase n=1 Tax=Andreesenia angusta TaxID=39480 RepID=A0A1S1VAB9_9FIRM|nr:glutamyl-tRNA reductase [Andreesenia angusta]OHW63444.1 glutamyl-tRNA reductase [Andreesenia angusta]